MGRTRIALVMAVLTIGAVALLPVSANAQSISELNRKLEQLKKAEAESKKQIEQKKRDAANLRSVIDDINDDISYTESRIRNTQEQIDATNAVIAALNSDISVRSSELDAFNSQLKSAYVSLYELSQANTLEMILVASSLDELITKTQYVQELQGSLQTKIRQVELIKADLESKKAEGERQKQSLGELSEELHGSVVSLDAQKKERNRLLNQTESERAAEETKLKEIQKQQISVNSEILRIYYSFSSGANYGGSGGYPWSNVGPWSNDQSCVLAGSGGCSYRIGHGIDTQDVRMFTRNCTSYAAWKWILSGGPNFLNGRTISGHAKNWPQIARSYGLRVDDSPEVGAIVSWPGLGAAANYGHVAIVEAVHDNGTITVSQYNARLDGRFSTQVKSSTWDNSLGKPSFIHR